MVALITSFFLLVRLVTAWGSDKEETVGGERGLKGILGEEELRRREEELSRREVEKEEGRGLEEWQRRMQGGPEIWDMEAMRKGKIGVAADDVQFIEVMRSKPKVSFSVSSTLDKLLQEERRLHNTSPRKAAVELPWPAGPTVGGGVPILPKGGAGGISGVKASLKV